jgi:hypothetical protein
VVALGEIRREPAEDGESKQFGIRRELLWGTIMAILALAAPISLIISRIGYETNYYYIALLWDGALGSFRLFRINHFFDTVLPFLCLRLVPVLQMIRYYRGNSTRKLTALIILIGDGVYLPGNIVALINSLSLSFPDWFLIPLPIQMIVGLLILWRAPLPEPTKPWTEQKESRDWWAESKKSLEEEGESL